MKYNNRKKSLFRVMDQENKMLEKERRDIMEGRWKTVPILKWFN